MCSHNRGDTRLPLAVVGDNVLQCNSALKSNITNVRCELQLGWQVVCILQVCKAAGASSFKLLDISLNQLLWSDMLLSAKQPPDLRCKEF